MIDINFEEHNKKSAEIWEKYNEKKPIKVPVVVYADVRNWLFEPSENKKGITLYEYLNDREIMLDCQVKTQEWIKHNILTDSNMGYPKEGWTITIDYQNYFEQVWLGGKVKKGIEPHSRPFLNDKNKYSIFDNGIPDAFEGVGAEAIDVYNCYKEKANNYLYKNTPLGKINLPYNMIGTDGPFTLACGIRGAEQFIMDILDDHKYAMKLMDYITTSIISRIKKIRKYLGLPIKSKHFGMADDSIVLLSTEMYKEFVFPFHKRIYNELSTDDSSRGMHLCGDAQRFFPILQKELRIMEFDTGFPIDFNKLYDELLPETKIYGGPKISLLKYGTEKQIEKEVKRILQSGVMEKSNRFVLREANALSPGTPIKNINRMYKTCEEYGYY